MYKYINANLGTILAYAILVKRA